MTSHGIASARIYRTSTLSLQENPEGSDIKNPTPCAGREWGETRRLLEPEPGQCRRRLFYRPDLISDFRETANLMLFCFCGPAPANLSFNWSSVAAGFLAGFAPGRFPPLP
jgi:hypothetical protein